MFPRILTKALAAGMVLTAASSALAQPVQGPNGHFYQLVSAPGITWTAAYTAAQNTFRCGQPGHLVTITSLTEQNFLVSQFGVAALSQKWMGAIQPNAIEVSTGWEWVTGEPFVFTSWAGGEPNNGFYAGHGYENAGVFWTGGNWNDGPSSWTSYGNGGYVIEWDVDATVIIGGCDSGVANAVVDTNTLCTISDLIAECAASATNHGEFVSCVAEVTNSLHKAGVITGAQKGRIQSCAAQSNIP